MPSIEELEKEIKEIKQRNKVVEGNKSWETSWARKIVIFVLTYIAISAYFYFAQLPDPFLNAVVPAFAFVLSTLTLPFFKKHWLKSMYNQ
ncbi:hypothetical protein K8R43_05090 [archaeon]|nr:hypothetical protein [archaeon]